MKLQLFASLLLICSTFASTALAEPFALVENPVGGAVKEQIMVREAETETPELDEESIDTSGKIYSTTEMPPSFPGGQAALMSWISSNLQYPERAQENAIQGSVIVQFVVNTDGTIEQVSILRGVDNELDNEAVRIVKGMPSWEPGKNFGMIVRSRYRLPISFKLVDK